MIYLRLESNLWSTEGICGGKLDVKSEYSSFVSIDLLAVGEMQVAVYYGDPCGPRMVARQCMISASSSGLALHPC